jgi:hypothetical protein
VLKTKIFWGIFRPCPVAFRTWFFIFHRNKLTFYCCIFLPSWKVLYNIVPTPPSMSISPDHSRRSNFYCFWGSLLLFCRVLTRVNDAWNHLLHGLLYCMYWCFTHYIWGQDRPRYVECWMLIHMIDEVHKVNDISQLLF